MSRTGAPSATYAYLLDPPGQWTAEAACAGLAPLHDPPGSLTDKGAALQVRLDQATAVCRSCPVLGQCRAWTETTPRAKVSGVLAGVFFPVLGPGDPGYHARGTTFPTAEKSAA